MNAFTVYAKKILTSDPTQLKYDEIKAQAIPGLVLSGCYKCPAVSCAENQAEVFWLINNHPNFRKYKRNKI